MALSLFQIIQLCAFSVFISLGQVFFKLSASTAPPIRSVGGLVSLATNVWFWAAIVLYGSATFLWILILQRVPLSLAYPFVALGFIIVPLVSWLLFKETLNFYYIAGAFLIIAGLAVIATLAAR